MAKTKMVAPDGGWGWMIILAMAVNNFITIPILQNFGLLFRDVFQYSLDLSVKEVSTIINTNSAFGYILGVLNGPLLRNYSFRKVAVCGSIMMFVGLFVTSFAKSFIVFFIFYGLLNSLGIGWSMASYHLALSTYFVERRGMAMGIAMTVTGIGPVVVPLLISQLLYWYGPRGATQVLSALVLNTLVTALLLQPVKWHRKPYVSDVSKMNGLSEHREEEDALHKPEVDARRNDQIDAEAGLLKNGEKNIEMEEFVKIKDPCQEAGAQETKKTTKKEEHITPWYTKLWQTLDLDLLQDPTFLSMTVGMSIALASDMNFSLMLPLILGDMNFDIATSAGIISVVGFADIVSRFFLSFILRKVKPSSRFTYLASLFGLILSRFWLTLVSDYTGVLLVVALFGASKGVRSVFMPLVIPNYVPLTKLPSAYGLQNVMHGLFLMIMGPVIGLVRDKTGNYTLCIHIMNCLTALTIVLWTLEFVYMKSQKKNTFVDRADAER